MAFVIGPDGRLTLANPAGQEQAPAAPPSLLVEDPSPVPLAAPEAPAAPAAPAPGAAPARPQPQWMNPPQGDLYRSLAAKYGLDNPDLTDASLKDAQRKDRLQGDLSDAGRFATSAMFKAVGMEAPQEAPLPSYSQELLQRRAAQRENLDMAKAIREEETARQTQALAQEGAQDDRDPTSGKSTQARAIYEGVRSSLAQAGVQLPASPPNATYYDLKDFVDPYMKFTLGAGQIATARENAEAQRNMTWAISQQGRTDKVAERNLKHDEETYVADDLEYVGQPGRYNKAAVEDLRATYKDLPETRTLVGQVVDAYRAYAAIPATDVMAKVEASHALEVAQETLKKAVLQGARARMNEKAGDFLAKSIPHITGTEMGQATIGETSAVADVEHKYRAWVDNQRAAAAAVARQNGYRVKPGSLLDVKPAGSTQGGHGGAPASHEPGANPGTHTGPGAAPAGGPRPGTERKVTVKGREVTVVYDGKGWKEKRPAQEGEH